MSAKGPVTFGVLFREAHGEATVTWLGEELTCKPRRTPVSGG